MHQKPSIVFLGTPDFAGELLEYIIANDLADVKAVFTQSAKVSGRGGIKKESGVANIANKLGVTLYQSGKISTDEYCGILRKLDVDFGLIIAFGQILSKDLFSIPRLGMLNLHFSALPLYRGASPLQSAILNGDNETGVTIQRVTEKLDCGDILMLSNFSLSEHDIVSAFEKSTEISKDMLTQLFKGGDDIFDRLSPQDESKATFCHKIKKSSGRVTEGMSVERIKNMVRAYRIWPGSFFYINNIKHDIVEVSDLLSEPKSSSSQLIREGKKKLLLSVADGALEIKRIKKENKKEMDIISFLNGCKLDFPVTLDTNV